MNIHIAFFICFTKFCIYMFVILCKCLKHFTKNNQKVTKTFVTLLTLWNSGYILLI